MGYWQHENHCYYFSINKQNWEKAEEFCATGNGHLASIENAVELAFLIGYLSDPDEIDTSGFDNFWIGGSNLVGSKWTWTDGNDFNYTKWKPGFPINEDVNQCITLDSAGLYANDNCFLNKKRFLCKLADSTKCPTCPRSYEMYQGFCYKVFHELTSWNLANSACVQEGGQLASIHSMEENRYINGLVLAQPLEASTSCDGAKYMWTGLQYSSTPVSNISWTDGTDTSFTYWSPGHPYSSLCGGVNDRCGIMFYGTGPQDAPWGTMPCSMRNAFYICKMPVK